MDCSYIEEESIHISMPYASAPRWSVNIGCENLDEGEHQISRPFESNIIDESESHHQFIPYWRTNPSKNNPNHSSRPNTSIVSVPIKKHQLDESSYIEEDDNDNAPINSLSEIYGKTGMFLTEKHQWLPPLENKFIEEFCQNPETTFEIINECKHLIKYDLNTLNKIIVDICVNFVKDKNAGDSKKEWVSIAKEFYQGMKAPIETNFSEKGILHYVDKSDYLVYLKNIEEGID